MAEDLELRMARKRQFSEFLEWEDRDGWSLKAQVEQSMLQRKGQAIALKTARRVCSGGPPQRAHGPPGAGERTRRE
jgi:hypothetical protein